MTPTAKIRPRDVIEAARHLARLSRDEMMPALTEQCKMIERFYGAAAAKQNHQEQQKARMDLVLDCYLTGAAEMLKRLNGDKEPEPWEVYDHEERLAELLRHYNALDTSAPQSDGERPIQLETASTNAARADCDAGERRTLPRQLPDHAPGTAPRG